MFRTAVCRAISPTALFLKQSKGKFGGKTYPANLWKAYAKLNVAAKNALIKKAANTPATRSKAFKTKKALKLKKRAAMVKAHAKNPYANFVKANYKKVNHMPVDKRFKALAKLWKLSK
jgi:hypothetical protein